MSKQEVISNHSGTSNSSFSIGGKRGITIFQGNDSNSILLADNGDIFVNKETGSCEIFSEGSWVELERKHEFQTVSESTYDILPLSGYVGCSYPGVVSLFLPQIFKHVQITIKDQTGQCGKVNPILIYPYGNDLIDGATSLKIESPYGKVTLVYNDNWYVS